jgi:hypothetical protein
LKYDQKSPKTLYRQNSSEIRHIRYLLYLHELVNAYSLMAWYRHQSNQIKPCVLFDVLQYHTTYALWTSSFMRNWNYTWMWKRLTQFCKYFSFIMECIWFIAISKWKKNYITISIMNNSKKIVPSELLLRVCLYLK